MRVLVTGGAGFIGSHICRRLVKDGHQVVAIDNLSNGSMENLKELENNSQFIFYKFDINNTIKLRGVFDQYPFDMVFHFAANADVSKGEESTLIDVSDTLQTTLSVLEMMRIYEIKKFFFASSSTVYGNAEERLQEHRSIMRPISHYGAAKLASEAFVSSFSHLHDFQVWIARFCNAVGPNMAHGVIPDLVKRLKTHPESLNVYGDGTQTKPYIWIDDLVEGVMTLLEKTNEPYNTYLVGVDSNVTVDEIAQIVMDEVGIHVPIHYGGRYSGWKGDVRQYRYDISQLRLMGWTPHYTAEQAVRKAVQMNMNNM
jgi:UDP-glucose 4-epimerase